METTVFNYCFDMERDGHEDAVKLFKAVSTGRYEGYASQYVMEELRQAPEPRRSNMLALADNSGITVLRSTPDVIRLSELYIANGVIPASQRYDSAHIAIASVYGLDFIISYNFRHINRAKTRALTAVVNRLEGYDSIAVCTAGEVLDND